MVEEKIETGCYVTLSKPDMRRFDAIVAELRMTKKAALGQLIEWFHRQEPMVRSVVMGHVPEDYAGDVIDIIYRRRAIARGQIPAPETESGPLPGERETRDAIEAAAAKSRQSQKRASRKRKTNAG